MTGAFLAHALPSGQGLLAPLVHVVGGGAFFLALLAVGAASTRGPLRARLGLHACFCLAVLVGAAAGASGRPLPEVGGPLAAAAVGGLLLAGERGPVALRAAPVALFGVVYGVVQGAHASEDVTVAGAIAPLLATAGLVRRVATSTSSPMRPAGGRRSARHWAD